VHQVNFNLKKALSFHVLPSATLQFMHASLQFRAFGRILIDSLFVSSAITQCSVLHVKHISSHHFSFLVYSHAQLSSLLLYLGICTFSHPAASSVFSCASYSHGNVGTPGWGSQLNTQLLVSAQVVVLGSWN